MPKPRKTLRIALPPYRPPRSAWRRAVLAAATEALRARGVRYESTDQLALHVTVYLDGSRLERIDVDNRLKDVMDALQGQVGGGGKKRRDPRRRVVRNDRQIWRVTVEKTARPRKLAATAGGRLVIAALRSAARSR